MSYALKRVHHLVVRTNIRYFNEIPIALDNKAVFFLHFFTSVPNTPSLKRVCSIFRKIGSDGHINPSHTPIIAKVDLQDTSDDDSRETPNYGSISTTPPPSSTNKKERGSQTR